MRISNTRSTVVLACGAVMSLLILAFWLLNRDRGPLAGDFSHDFGMVTLTHDKPTELKHSFRLTNQSDDIVRLVAARPDCGCVNARQGLPANIMPGQTFELPITMAMSATFKEVVIYLELGDGGEQKLRVKATGVPADATAPQETRPESPTSVPADH